MVLAKAWTGGFRVQSDFARKHAVVVGMAASCDYLSTLRPDGNFGPDWYVTRRGIALLEHERDLGTHQ